jgi:hypothetical protein
MIPYERFLIFTFYFLINSDVQKLFQNGLTEPNPE